MRLKLLSDEEVKSVLQKHLDINYQSLNDKDEDWVRFQDQIAFAEPGAKA